MISAARKTVDASAMVTVGPEHPAWQDPLKLGDEVSGAFVRLDPPLNCPDEDVVRMRVHVEELGAVAVKTLPVRRDDVVATEAKAEVAQPHATARTTVDELFAESRSRSKELLRTTLDGAMDAASL